MDRQAWDERYATSELVWTAEVNRFVAEHLAGLRPGTAVDLAAGECRNAVWLAERGWRVVAVDFSRVALQKGLRLAAHHGVEIDVEVADATTWQPAAPVDLVVLAYLQLPAGPRRAVLERAAGWLGPGGHLFVVAHDRRNVDEGHGGPSSPEVCYDLEGTLAALGGLEVDVATVAERPVSTPEGTRVALDTVVLAHRAP